MRAVLVALVLASVTAGAARAETIASPPSYADGQALVVCRLYNAGSTTVTFDSTRVVPELAPFDLTISSTCTGRLAAGKSCSWSARILSGGAHLCRVNLSSRTNVRGVMQLLNTFAYPLNSVEMR